MLHLSNVVGVLNKKSCSTKNWAVGRPGHEPIVLKTFITEFIASILAVLAVSTMRACGQYVVGSSLASGYLLRATIIAYLPLSKL